MDKIKSLCCTLDGLNKVKKVLTFFTGIAVIIWAVFDLITSNWADPLQWLGKVRSMWNCLFGLLMMFLQWKWDKWITTRFGFLNGWFGRGMFYLFVGSNIMVQYEGCVFCWLSWIVRRARPAPRCPLARAQIRPSPPRAKSA